MIELEFIIGLNSAKSKLDILFCGISTTTPDISPKYTHLLPITSYSVKYFDCNSSLFSCQISSTSNKAT